MALSPSEKMTSGVPGLDRVLGGGLRPGHLYFVEGEPGSGKTTLGLQFAVEGLRRGESSLVVSMAESAEEIATIAESHGLTLDGVAVRDLGAPGAVRSTALFELSEVELDDRVQAIIDEMDNLKPQRFVLDTLAALRAFSSQRGQFRRHVEQFRSKALELGTTMLITDELTGTDDLHPRSLAWGVVRLEQRLSDYGPPRRRLWVPKLRGQAFAGGYHDMRIISGGVQVFPRLDSRLPSPPFESAQLTSGIPGIDTLLGGGVEPGTSLGIIGPPGCGKSTVACNFALAATARGERAVLYAFDESLDTLRLRACSQGLDLDTPIASGLLQLRQVDPAELSPGELSQELAEEVLERGTRLIVIDSLNGYLQAMPDERFMNLHVHSLLSWLGKRGVLTLLTLAQPSPLTKQEGLTVDLSYLTDTVIAQRYFEAYGSLRHAISVMKKRYGNHERMIREYRITDSGIEVGEPLSEFRGVLSGIPEYIGKQKPLL